MKRLFFALWPDDKIRNRIDKFNHCIHSSGLKKVKRDNFHMTLVFLGNVDAKAEVWIKNAVQTISVQPFVVHFDQLDFWRKPRILCLTASRYGTELLSLVDALNNAVEPLGFKIEERPYKPHVTLARKAVRKVDCDVTPIAWQAQSFCLVESCSTPDGVDYRVLQSWSFS